MIEFDLSHSQAVRMMSASAGMIQAELMGIDLGDLRLNQRSQKVLQTLAAKPQASINSACQTWTETHAAYRFFDNPKVSPEKILAPHLDATRERMRQQPVVLIVQDTTELDFTPHPPQDARCLDQATRFGCYDHTSLAVTPDRICLGVVGQELFDRAPESLGKRRERASLPIEEKESDRWLQGYRLACQIAEKCPQTKIVSVADSEADIYEIFVEGRDSGHLADFLIRAKEDRASPERDLEAGPRTYRKVWDEVRASPLRLKQTIELSHTPKRQARQAHLEIRAKQVRVKAPRVKSQMKEVVYNIVMAEEAHPPEGQSAIQWLLITTLPIDTNEQILTVLDYYLARWTIEVYFRILKTGCTVEKIQLETMQRMANCLTFYKIIAWRVLYTTHYSREFPDVPCDVLFTSDEWQSVWQIVKKSLPPETPPRLGEFIRLLAELGGYNNRRTDPPPGPQAIWTGLTRMLDFTLAWQAFQELQKKRCV